MIPVYNGSVIMDALISRQALWFNYMDEKGGFRAKAMIHEIIFRHQYEDRVEVTLKLWNVMRLCNEEIVVMLV